jgi:hypothetical protein
MGPLNGFLAHKRALLDSDFKTTLIRTRDPALKTMRVLANVLLAALT